MIRLTPPEPGTWRYRLADWFVTHINFCEGYSLDGTPKPENRLYNWLYAHWLWPFEQNDCLCCNTVRGVIYGMLIGYLLGRI